MSRDEDTDANPSLAILSARLLLSVQDEIFSRLQAQGCLLGF